MGYLMGIIGMFLGWDIIRDIRPIVYIVITALIIMRIYKEAKK